jgi:hypothetical protein
MAKLSAHGSIVGTLHFVSYSKRWMSDGHILRNGGDGWKLHAKLQAGVDVAEHFRKAESHMAQSRASRPARAAYIKLLHGMAGVATRWKLHTAVSLMPNDPDGVWSECCDGYGDNVHADLDDVCELCRAYEAMEREAAEARALSPATAEG